MNKYMMSSMRWVRIKPQSLDGFPPRFFHTYWNTMEEDVTRVIQ